MADRGEGEDLRELGKECNHIEYTRLVVLHVARLDVDKQNKVR